MIVDSAWLSPCLFPLQGRWTLQLYELYNMRRVPKWICQVSFWIKFYTVSYFQTLKCLTLTLILQCQCNSFKNWPMPVSMSQKWNHLWRWYTVCQNKGKESSFWACAHFTFTHCSPFEFSIFSSFFHAFPLIIVNYFNWGYFIKFLLAKFLRVDLRNILSHCSWYLSEFEASWILSFARSSKTHHHFVLFLFQI